MPAFDLTAPTNAELRRIRHQAHQLRSQELARMLRRLFAFLVAGPRLLVTAPTSARPLHH